MTYWLGILEEALWKTVQSGPRSLNLFGEFVHKKLPQEIVPFA
jgi:hypothetical protein